jgi:hypothetical protein
MIKAAHDQIITWYTVIESLYNHKNDHNFMERLYVELSKMDIIFSNLFQLDREIQSRESFSIRQSVNGIIGYIKKKKKSKK